MQSSGSPITLVRPTHDLTVETMRHTRAELAGLLDEPGHVLLDLRAVSLDSTGLGAVLSLQRQLELLERRLAVIGTDPAFMTLLDRTGALDALTLFAEPEPAAEYLRNQPHPEIMAA